MVIAKHKSVQAIWLDFARIDLICLFQNIPRLDFSFLKNQYQIFKVAQKNFSKKKIILAKASPWSNIF